MNEKSRKIILRMSIVAIFSSMMMVSALLMVPFPGGAGYFNFTDVFVIVVACMVNPLAGALVGLIGGALADLITGYFLYIPFTAAIKFLEGLLVGILYRNRVKYIRYIACFVGGLLMAFLYTIPDYIYFGTGAMLANLPFNLLQGLINATIGYTIILLLSRTKFKVP